VLATRVKNAQNHQVGIREEPLLSLRTSRFRGLGQKTKMLAAGQRLKVRKADTREPGDFLGSEQLLAGFDCDHVRASHLF